MIVVTELNSDFRIIHYDLLNAEQTRQLHVVLSILIINMHTLISLLEISPCNLVLIK